MQIDPILVPITLLALVVLVAGLLFRTLRGPSVLGYLLAGIVVGPHGLGLLEDETLIRQLGAIGVDLLLFFVGMELVPAELLRHAKVAVWGTLLQVIASVAGVVLLGYFLDWTMARMILLGFVLSLSSTAVALRFLDGKRVDPGLRGPVTAILVAQDVVFVPMILVLGLIRGESPEVGLLVRQTIGAIGAVLFILWIARRESIRLGIGRWIAGDPELPVFAGLIICFGMSLLTGKLGLSTALGAFLAGLLLSAARETQWIQPALAPFRVVFVALFFLSVGMVLDIGFVVEHLGIVSVLAGAALVTNTGINAVILRIFGCRSGSAWHGGAILAQIGELSFVLAAIGWQQGIVNDYSYQMTAAVITVTLIASPLWVRLFRSGGGTVGSDQLSAEGGGADGAASPVG